MSDKKITMIQNPNQPYDKSCVTPSSSMYPYFLSESVIAIVSSTGDKVNWIRVSWRNMPWS